MKLLMVEATHTSPRIGPLPPVTWNMATEAGSAASLPEGFRSCSGALGSWTLHSSLGPQLRAFWKSSLQETAQHPPSLFSLWNSMNYLIVIQYLQAGFFEIRGRNQDRIRLCMIKSCWVTFNFDFWRFPEPLRAGMASLGALISVSECLVLTCDARSQGLQQHILEPFTQARS